jgi:hypothetical protein
MTFTETATDTTYNGWANYETWNVSLWIGNDEFLYNTAKACVTYNRDLFETPYDAFIRCMSNCDSFTTGDDVRWDDVNINRDEINEMMEEL